MFCGKCGKEIQDNVRFCPECGNQIAEQTPIPIKDIKVEQVSAPTPDPTPTSTEESVKTASAGTYTSAPEKRVKVEKTKGKKKKSVPAIVFGGISLFLAAAILLMAFGVFSLPLASPDKAVSASSYAPASKSFNTPEEAIEYFIENIKKGDIDEAFSACAINEMANGHDFEAYYEEVGNLLMIDSDYYAGGFTLFEYDGNWLISILDSPFVEAKFGAMQGALAEIDGQSEFADILEQ